jgi:hypothetical protein
VSRDFLILVFFHESVSPKPLNILLGPFRIFSKIRGDIRGSRLTTGITTPVSLVLLIPVANLPPVSTMAAVNLPLVSKVPTTKEFGQLQKNSANYKRIRPTTKEFF